MIREAQRIGVHRVPAGYRHESPDLVGQVRLRCHYKRLRSKQIDKAECWLGNFGKSV